MQAFISYAHDDYRAFTEFSACLKPVARAFGIDVWADKRLKAGHYWDARIKAAIDASDMYVLLMSTRFLASDYIFDHELPAIEARSRSGALTLPVVNKRNPTPYSGVGVMVVLDENYDEWVTYCADITASAHGRNGYARNVFVVSRCARAYEFAEHQARLVLESESR